MGKVMPAEELAGTKASKGPHPSCWAASSSSETGPRGTSLVSGPAVPNSFLLDCGHLPGAPPQARPPGTGALDANASSDLSLQPPPNPGLVRVSWRTPQ